MNFNICNNCGAEHRPDERCPVCGAFPLQGLPPKAQSLLAEAFNVLRSSRYDEAKTAFEKILKKYPETAEAYWGRLRARYHISYNLTGSGRSLPKCPTRSGAKLTEDVDYRKAIELADGDMKAFLGEQAEFIEVSCGESTLSKNMMASFTMGEVNANDELKTSPKKSKKPIILSAALSLVLIGALSVCFAMGLFHRHTPGAAATCTEAQICEKCGDVLAEALGHTLGKEANCTEAQSCTVCNAELTAALGHKPGTEATCTEAQNCSVCNAVLVGALGHKPGAGATCTEAQNCSVCNAVLTTALGHKPGTAATCTTPQNCTVCNTVLTAALGALGHKPGAAATCTKSQNCTVCNAELVAALGHKPGTEATCTEAQICTVCNTELAAATGHTPGEWVTITPATKMEDGSKETHCTACGEKITEAIPAFGSEGLSYSDNGDGTYSVSGIGTCTDTEVVIPATYNGKPVTKISTPAFYGCSSLTTITIPDSVTIIGNSAFRDCSSLTSISIPDSVTSIGYYAFFSCSSLTTITIPDSVTSIGEYAFYGCSGLTSITIPEGVTSIGGAAFYYCYSLTSITIPEDVTSIGWAAFYDCRSLTSITFTGTTAQWKAIAFGSSWHSYTGAYTVYCTDGTVSKDGTVTPY